MTTPVTSKLQTPNLTGANPTALGNATGSAGSSDPESDLATQLLNQNASSSFSSSGVVAQPIITYPVSTPVTSNPIVLSPSNTTAVADMSVSDLAQPSNYQSNSNEIWASADEVYKALGLQTPPTVDQRAEVRAILFAVQDAQQSGHNPVINNNVSLLDPANIDAIAQHVTQHMTGDSQAQLGGGTAAYNSVPPSAQAQQTIANVLTIYASRPTDPIVGSMSDDNGVMSSFTPSAGTGWQPDLSSTSSSTYSNGVAGDGQGTLWSSLSPAQESVSLQLNSNLQMKGVLGVSSLDTDNFMAALNDASATPVSQGGIDPSQPLNSPQNVQSIYSAMQKYAQGPSRPDQTEVAQFIQALPTAYKDVMDPSTAVLPGQGTAIAQLNPQQSAQAVNVANSMDMQNSLGPNTLDTTNVVAALNDVRASGNYNYNEPVNSLNNTEQVYNALQNYSQGPTRPGLSDVAEILGNLSSFQAFSRQNVQG